MAYEEALLSITRPAAVGLIGLQYRFVTVDASGNLALTGNGAEADAVLQDKPTATGNAAAAAIVGVSKVEAGASFNAGDLLTSDGNGKAKVAGTGDVINARALEAGASGRIVSVLTKF